MQCQNCRFRNPPGFKLCGECGSSLSDKSIQSKDPEPERRQLTVMFCDLVGFTALSGQTDPEELREFLQAYQRGCAEAIHLFGGYIAQYLGDGLLVYFGYPFAYEDSAERAVRAGLRIVRGIDELPLLKRRLRQDIRVRIEIHTGVVVMGDVGGREGLERLALGDTPSIASRIQGIAEPNTVLIGGSTYRLVEWYFDCHDLGIRELKGVTSPVRIYRVLGEKERASRFEAAVARGLTPFVGREEERGFLHDCWNRIKDGSGKAVLISGEAGIGKSRLLEEFKKGIDLGRHMVLECQCVEYHRNSAFYP